MLSFLNTLSRNVIRTSVINNPAYGVPLQRAFFSDEIKADDSSTKTDESSTKTLGGFARAFEKFEKAKNFTEPKPVDNATFLSLLRNSKFIDMGDPVNKIVTGKIFHIVDDDLYIDFGWKFHCVCTRPQQNADDYIRGARVKLRVKDLELSSKFLGSEKDLTILEADCQLIGLVSSPRNATTATQ
ncbi:28S ribosomal protein S28, mitochondrial [Bradysia coprophila]|uniref:28S ribosomal protein S28, mitochondrial n=1 Tax=Bradysia coprophila TaxID=38358 RepID=UPI00187DAC8D|nr:28S ribosomal protein S28, mitochondrial [Bradysia coprophila]XP_037036005.1 28S ribosomal protein S28, mitochondrial [Bradysia coprophila]